MNYFNTAIVAGWGRTSSGGQISENLREVEVDVMTRRQCKKNSAYEKKYIHKRVVCARAPDKDSCQVFELFILSFWSYTSKFLIKERFFIVAFLG